MNSFPLSSTVVSWKNLGSLSSPAHQIPQGATTVAMGQMAQGMGKTQMHIKVGTQNFDVAKWRQPQSPLFFLPLRMLFPMQFSSINCPNN
jgi:hypothetical protein